MQYFKYYLNNKGQEKEGAINVSSEKNNKYVLKFLTMFFDLVPVYTFIGDAIKCKSIKIIPLSQRKLKHLITI